ncbi:MAG: ChrR family anti-sigma-E factor [Marinibacterium sp.]|nr:ChrR family anti-sigma-E factor [Marinibacterium sp.]
MTIKHHLSDDILMAYSAGTLPEAFNLFVASHLSVCDTCRATVESYDAVGGALLDTASDGMDLVTGDMAMSAGALSAVMERIAQPPQSPAPRRRKPGPLPGPLQDYVGGGLEDVKWRPVGMGVRQAILPTSDAAIARLLYIPAGTAVPDHSHRGTELTMVLQGAFEDEYDRFGPGDVEIADHDVQHMPVADISQDCICLAVTDAPLRFKGLLPRLAQPFLRI